MKTFIADIIPKIRQYSQKLDNLTLLTNQHWVVVDELKDSKYVYIFRSNNELLISQNGKVEKGKWEYLGNNSLLIDKKDESYLFRHGFFDDTVLALKIDGKDEYAFLVNEGEFGQEVNSLETVFNFLENRYLNAIKLGTLQLSFPDEFNEKEANEEFTFRVVKEKQYWDIFKGTCIQIFIDYNNGEFNGDIIFIKNKKSYGYFYGTGWKIIEDRAECIREYFKFLRKSKIV
jgi:hypothetical protein